MVIYPRIQLEQLNPTIVAAFGATPCLIWSAEHRAYWRAANSGYTKHRDDAGRYTIEEAYAATRHCDPSKAIQFERVDLREARTADTVDETSATIAFTMREDPDPVPFWLVWSPSGERPPSHRHESAAAAEAEAERLAHENPGREFYVVEPIFAVTVGMVRRHRFDPDGVPF